jgi:hypothetical protein
MLRTSTFDRLGFALRTSAATPETYGAEADVPLNDVYSLAITMSVTFTAAVAS